MHVPISPAILYWGTPVVLISSLNEDGTTNIAPMSSAFWLGHRCMVGLAAASKTPQNIQRTGQCVLNLASDDMFAAVNALACTTGTEKVGPSKLSRGYRYVADKWTCSGLTPQKSDIVAPLRVQECPVQMECKFVAQHDLFKDTSDRGGLVVSFELQILRVHVIEELKMQGYPNRIDPDKWRPMIMSFQELYGLHGQKLGESVLGRIPEEKYRPLAVGFSAAKQAEDQQKHEVEQLASSQGGNSS